MRQTVGLIGYPLGHSISPVFQQAAFDHLGLDVRYELWETKSQDLRSVVKDILLPEKLGSNVTVPYKEEVIPFLNDLDELARDIGAVNTIVKRDGKLMGYNTDAGGFLRSLSEKGQFDPQGKRVTMIGAGGVARAISFVLIKAGVISLHLYDIEIERAQKLSRDIKSERVEVIESVQGPEYSETISSADLLVNCTPIGMKHSPSEDHSPVPKNLISSKSLVYDVVYNPLQTRLLKDASEMGARTLGGLSMLVYQGVDAFELWTGQQAPVDIMMEKAQGAL